MGGGGIIWKIQLEYRNSGIVDVTVEDGKPCTSFQDLLL